MQSADRGLHTLRDGFGECSCIAFDDKRFFIVEEVGLVAVDAADFLVREVRELFRGGELCVNELSVSWVVGFGLIRVGGREVCFFPGLKIDEWLRVGWLNSAGQGSGKIWFKAVAEGSKLAGGV